MDDHALLEGAGLGGSADEDGHLAQRVAVAAEALDALADHAGLLVGVPEADDADRVAGSVVAAGAKGFPEAALVVGDEGGGGPEDGGGAAVVAFEADDDGPGEVVFEAKDVFDFGTAPGVDGLVVVADAAEVAVGLGEEAEPEVLDDVGVLVFVDEDVAEASTVFGEDVGAGAENLDHVEQEVAEVAGVELA